MPVVETDQKVLCQKSEPANDLEIGDIVQQLSITIPDHALGLAAPQIGIHKRIFLANLSRGSYAFINPQLIWKTIDKVPSEESCLSLPGICRCVERYARVEMSCYTLIDMTTGDVVVEPGPMTLKGRDSYIVQHENDHLNGVLLIQLPITMTLEERRRHKEKQREERIGKARESKAEKFMKTLLLPKSRKLSAKNQAKKKREAEKAKRKQRTVKRQKKIRVEIQERHKAEKEGLFLKSTPSASNAENPDNQD